MELRSALDLDGRVSFLDYREDIGALMAAADGLVLASRWEGLPNVILEACVAGLPVVATSVGGVTEIIELQHPQLWMDPGPLGTLGVGPGYAMAAKLARPDANVVLVYGDGSFGLHGIEFEAMARQDIPVIALIGNDAGWTQIRRGQIDMYGAERAVATELEHTRYEKIVEACGGRGFWVETIEELGPALDEAFSCRRPACVNVKIAKSDFRKGAISV